jgi:hypothetical protein
MDHPKPAVLRRFLQCSTSRREKMEVVRHLLQRCGACSAALRELGSAPALLNYDHALTSFLKKAAEQAVPL